MKILHVVPTYYPATYFGGPIESVYQLCNHIAEIPGVELKVVTSDSSGPRIADRLTAVERSEARYTGYDVNFSRRLLGTSIAPGMWPKIWALAGWADVIHLTAVYSSTTFPTLWSALARGRPVVWSPRGALQRWPGSRRIVAKSIWDRACRASIRERRTLLHVTSQEEGDESAARLPGLSYEVIPNGIEVPAVHPSRDWRPGGKLRIGFLGRLDPKKGMENLIDALGKLPPESALLDVYGAGDPSYLGSLRERAGALEPGHPVHFHGAVAGEAKSGAFHGMDVLVVPSHTENFAMVVGEGMAHGVPVIASTGTPWKEIEPRRAGRWVSNDPTSLMRALESMRDADLAGMGMRGLSWMAEVYQWSQISARMVDAYRRLLAGTGI